jgi:hypothetical protein
MIGDTVVGSVGWLHGIDPCCIFELGDRRGFGLDVGKTAFEWLSCLAGVFRCYV